VLRKEQKQHDGRRDADSGTLASASASAAASASSDAFDKGICDRTLGLSRLEPPALQGL
jgi:hypothetical protein